MDNGDTRNFELDQFNLDTSSEDWGDKASGVSSANQTADSEHNQRALGNTATASISEVNPDISPRPNSTPETASGDAANSELGQVTPLMPPGYPGPESHDSQDSHPAEDFQVGSIIQKIQNGGNLTPKEANYIETDFNNTELADAYDKYRPEPVQEIKS